MTIIHSPKEFGHLAGSSLYPGLILSGDLAHKEVYCRQVQRFNLSDGDLVTLSHVDGGSPILLFATTTNAQPAFDQLGLSECPLNEYHFGHLNSILDASDLETFCHQGTATNNSVLGYSVFDANTLPDERFVLRCSGTVLLWVAFPLSPDTPAIGGGGSLLVEHVQKTPLVDSLPEPLGKVRKEFHIDSGTAQAYKVKAGEYIQVIDIEGQQCSDFMAMRVDALEEGKERHIDSTVTRTLVGSAYPGPGLCDKFYDQDMQPLLAVVQDTVGRHDTFALACTARGYEDRGFPGHLNCSDNISYAYEPYGIARRAAWPAINFFFNSTIDPSNNHLTSSEAWSRPGDYVVMQALTDLICVSTACPDDVDPINGWNPTDIHVRIYPENCSVQRAVAYRPFVESEANMTIESAFHSRTSQLTQSFSVARDVWLPTSYDSSRSIDEYWACRNSVTIQDMSALRKYDIMGPDAETLLQLCLTRNVSRVSVNRGSYALMCSDTGSVIDDGTLFRLNHDVFRWCCGSEESARQLKTIATQYNLKVWVKALWSAMPNLAIQGPKSRELLSKIIFTQPDQPSLENVKWFGFTIARLHDRNGPAFMLTRSGFTGELGYEIFCDCASAESIWDGIMEAGEEFDIMPMGSEALGMKRIEAGLMVAGAEFTPDIDAFESGLGFAIDMKKETFIGREALERNASSPRKSLVGLHIDGAEVPHHGAPIFYERNQVGVVTSATRSPELEQVIALARVSIEYSGTGTSLEIGCLDGHIKRLPATVCSFPFVDPKRERARA